MAKEMTAYERVQIARHSKRPYTLDIIENIFDDFEELHGDRRFYDDSAIVGGFAKLDEIVVAVIGQQKGRDTNQRRERNFGMPKPEGYRKALRIMKLAEKFARPIITFIDTPGAFPGVDAEERGQAEAIAYNLREMSVLRVPVIVVIVGEGGSGGALAIGIGDRILMLENAVYSVISPEGCAAILWKDAAMAETAAACLKLTAEELYSNGLVDEIIKEKVIWEFEKTKEDSEPDAITKNLKTSLMINLLELTKIDEKVRLSERHQKFRKMGEWI